ncbi:sialoadhesin [Elgaria multicarinata webbii]|uniref:sialoadhesin n=1 Tax=Elgaria multicarinata webbii TaxID=159646 RepID=UPI002FCD3188
MWTLLFLLGFAHSVDQAFASWVVTYPQSLQSIHGYCAVIPCTFSFPSNVAVTAGITAIWFKDHSGERITIYHSATPASADARFRGRTELLGDPLKRNCTLLLRTVTSEDSGNYYFRFEISDGNRWSQQNGVQLTVANKPDPPTIAAPGDLNEGVTATFDCSSPYVCPYGNSSLQWMGYNAETSLVTEMVQLDTTAALKKESLRTSLSWKDHNQKMICELFVGMQRVAGGITLRVKHAPKGVTVSLKPPTKNIRVGDAASLTCNVSSSYPEVTSYRWFKDGVPSGNEKVKSFRSIARNDYGLYHCEAGNSVGAGIAEAVTLYVFSAVLQVSPSSSVREGEKVTLTCDVPGEDMQEIHYSWYKNNIWIKEGSARSLVFLEVAVGDTGYYSCKVQNDKGSEMSQAIGLSVFYPPRAPSLTLFQETQEGRLAIVYCTVDSNPQSTLSLYRGKQLIATTSSHSVPNQRISITTTRNSLKLEIKKVIPEDEGEYECTATNTYGDATTTHLFGAQTARVVVRPSNELAEGEEVTLACLATLGPEEEITYTWYKNAKWLQEGKENSLVFPAVASSDAGTFHCVARSKKGSNTAPAVTLRVLYSPRLPVMTSLLQTQGGHLGIIQCTVDSDPPSEMALHKGDTLIGSTSSACSAADPRVTVTPSYNVLKVTIRDVMMEDEGPYMCSAQNRYGHSTASMDFTAETAKITVKPSPEVREGEALHLSCAMSSNSSTLANYTWYKDGLLLPEAFGDSLELRRAERGDAGLYSCRVETQRASKSSSSVALSVLYPPGTPQVAVFMETKRGRVAIFRCSVDSNPPAKLVLYKGEEVTASSALEPSVASRRISVTAARNAMRVEMREIVPEDEGSYNLTATNAYGSSSRVLYFHVQTARVLVTPSPALLEGDTASLTCDVMGSALDDSTFSWYKNSRRIPESNGSTLAFPRIASGDTGSYHCKAHAPDETSTSVSSSVSLTVYYPPRKPQMTSFLQTQAKQVATIRCTVESEPESQLTIYKGRELLASSITSGNAHNQRVKVSTTYNSLSVEIWGVVMEDEGEYVCSATNKYGNASSTMTFTAETARIWISPPDVLEGNSVNLTCAVDSDAAGESHYTWYKDGTWYAEGSSETLAFPHADIADTGSYYCTVKTREKIRNSSLGTLNVFYPPRNAQVKSFLETRRAQLASIVCTVDSNPPSALLLRRAGDVLAASAFRIRGGPDPRLSTASSLNSLRLEITGVGLEDEGVYECVASNGVGEASTSLDFRVETTRVVIKPGPEVREGDRVSLTCEDTSSSSTAAYTWYKNSQWLSEGSANSLLFQAVVTSDGGSYACQAHHERGIRKAPPVNLHVLYAPKKPSLTSFLEMQSSNRAIIQCTVESHPPSDLALYRGSVIVASSRNSRILPTWRLNVHSAHNSLKLEIQEVLLEDEGQYHCLANNTYGNSAASLHFGVESARVTIDPAPDIQEGATANLTCVVASQAMVERNYTWYKNSRWLQESSDQSLMLAGVSKVDTGSYHCQAAGRTGSATSALVNVNVLYAPTSLSLSAYLDNQKGKVGILSCRVDSHPRSRLTLYKGGQLMADSKSSHSAAGQRFLVLPSYNSLRLEIRDIRAEDSGQYACQASNRFGNTTSVIDFSAGTLSDLHMFKILAGIFIALTCAAVLCGLVLGVARNWAWMNEEWKKWKQMKSKKEESAEVDNKEDTVQLNEQNPETPPSGRFCLSYRRLQVKTKTPPREDPPGQTTTSDL